MRPLVFFYLALYDAVNAFHFNYINHQKEWSKHFDTCGGKWQSPISIRDSQVSSQYFRALEIVGYHNFLPTPLTIHNNGHSVSLAISKKSLNLPQIFGAKLRNIYEIESLHFHWGERNNRGSEHILNGIRYPMEMHIIHRNKKYHSVEEALQHSDGLSVLAIFFQLFYKDNQNLIPIVSNLHLIAKPDETVTLNNTFTLSSLLPHDLDRFYTYNGSLTTPPCTEAVTWIIFPDTIPISHRQLTKFRMLTTDTSGVSLVDNYRTIQPIRRRKIYMRKYFIRDKRYLCRMKLMTDLDC